MKTILVATDFSKSSKNAAYYALKLADALKADVELCHAYSVPAESPFFGQVSWALYEQPDLEKENIKALQKLVEDLEEKEYILTNDTASTFHASISYTCETGDPVEVITAVANKTKAILIVMGMTEATVLSRLFFGSTSLRIMDHMKHPILLVPANYRFTSIKKIVFATDLNPKDIKTAEGLMHFAHSLDALLVIAHVSDFSDLIDENSYSHKKEHFLKSLEGNVHYRFLQSENIDDGLDLLKNKDTSLLVMGHRHRNFFDRLAPGSHAARQAAETDIPLLIIPEEIPVHF